MPTTILRSSMMPFPPPTTEEDDGRDDDAMARSNPSRIVGIECAFRSFTCTPSTPTLRDNASKTMSTLSFMTNAKFLPPPWSILSLNVDSLARRSHLQMAYSFPSPGPSSSSTTRNTHQVDHAIRRRQFDGAHRLIDPRRRGTRVRFRDDGEDRGKLRPEDATRKSSCLTLHGMVPYRRMCGIIACLRQNCGGGMWKLPIVA